MMQRPSTIIVLSSCVFRIAVAVGRSNMASTEPRESLTGSVSPTLPSDGNGSSSSGTSTDDLKEALTCCISPAFVWDAKPYTCASLADFRKAVYLDKSWNGSSDAQWLDTDFVCLHDGHVVKNMDGLKEHLHKGCINFYLINQSHPSAAFRAINIERSAALYRELRNGGEDICVSVCNWVRQQREDDLKTIAMSDVRRLSLEVKESIHDICETQFLIDEVLQKVADQGYY